MFAPRDPNNPGTQYPLTSATITFMTPLEENIELVTGTISHPFVSLLREGDAIEAMANGLGNANGEILGGMWTLLVSLAALRSAGLPKVLNFLGLLVGAIGILTILPALNDLTGLFGMGQIIWFVWLGIVLLRTQPRATA